MLEGPCVANVPVRVSPEGTLGGKWVVNAGVPGCHVVETPLSSLLSGREPNPRSFRSAVQVTVEPGARCVIVSGCQPWKVGVPTNDQVAMAERSVSEGVRRAREKARSSSEPVVRYENARREKVYSLRVNHRCEHPEHHWTRRGCSHVWCEMCDGYVDPLVRTALKGPGPIIKCNRRPQGWSSYLKWFRENFAGSAALTAAMRRTLPKDKVADPRDKRYSPQHDLLDKKCLNVKRKR